MWSLIRRLAMTSVLLTAACASRETATPPATTDTGGSEPDVIAWVDRPAPPYIQPTPTPTPLPTDARPCRAADLTASQGELGAAAGTTNIRIDFTNRSDTACLLLGHPGVAGVSSDGAVTPLPAAHGSIIGDTPWPAANISPGQSAAVNISSADACTAAQRGQQQTYPTLRITLPSRDHLDVSSQRLDTICGISVSRFGVPADAPPPQEPASPLTAHISAPARARAGENLTYTITLRNRSHTAYPLTPCPAYEEYLVQDGASLQPSYYLNCDTIHEIPAGGAVTYQMRLKLPVDLGDGQAKFGWRLHGEAGPYAAEIMQIMN
jgi:Protein of unknown function (DUF4232)